MSIKDIDNTIEWFNTLMWPQDLTTTFHVGALRSALLKAKEVCEAEADGRLTITPKREKKVPKDVYADDELRYAAYAKCKCGAGLAYPKGYDLCDINSWDCSDVLTGRVKDGDEHESYPFAFYEIKSEDQPSAQGATTRR